MRAFVDDVEAPGKFWNVELQGSSLTVTSGKVGSKGRARTKELPDPETALGTVERMVDLGEEVKDGRELLSGDADAIVADAEYGLTAGTSEFDIDPPSQRSSIWTATVNR